MTFILPSWCSMSDQCARDSAGNLLDASQIDFYESESDEKALPAVIVPPRRGDRKRRTDKLAASLLVEQEDKDGHAPVRRAPRATRTTSTRVKAVPESISEEEDEDFAMPDLKDASDSEDSDSEDEQGVDNDEIADLLPSKTVPARGGVPSRSRKRVPAVPGGSASRPLSLRAPHPPRKPCVPPPLRSRTKVTLQRPRSLKIPSTCSTTSRRLHVVLPLRFRQLLPMRRRKRTSFPGTESNGITSAMNSGITTIVHAKTSPTVTLCSGGSLAKLNSPTSSVLRAI
ncbi:hypothetical protein DFH09DRAFT_1274914 [Mycena vulgaris]|nr:hypothetical protein DFH09DRAFT_1274914 [Mycena vulgaris]